MPVAEPEKPETLTLPAPVWAKMPYCPPWALEPKFWMLMAPDVDSAWMPAAAPVMNGPLPVPTVKLSAVMAPVVVESRRPLPAVPFAVPLKPEASMVPEVAKARMPF